MKKVLLYSLSLLLICLSLLGCTKKVSNKSIIISNVDPETRWNAINKFDITLLFENDICISEDYYLEFDNMENASTYAESIKDEPLIENFIQEGNIIKYSRVETNNEFFERTYDEAYNDAKMLYPTSVIIKE